MATHCSILAQRILWTEEPGGLPSMGLHSQTRLKQLSMHARIEKGNGNPFQYSCLENPRDRGAWWTAIYGVAELDMTEATQQQQLVRKAMTNLDSVLKSRDITLPTKVHIVKAMGFPLVMYRCESWTIKKSEHLRTDDSELWCWRRLLNVPWTARRSNQSILKEINPEVSLEESVLKPKLQYFGHLLQRDPISPS